MTSGMPYLVSVKYRKDKSNTKAHIYILFHVNLFRPFLYLHFDIQFNFPFYCVRNIYLMNLILSHW